MHLFYSDTSDGILAGQQGNISEDPLFVNPADPLGPDGVLGTADDGFQLQQGSPCIDAGHAAFLDANHTRSEMGAYGDALPTVNLSEIHANGSNVAGPWDGSLERPYQYIWEAMLAASDGASVQVAAGTYEENLVFRSDKTDISLVGAGTETTIVDGGSRAGVMESWFAEGYEIADFTLQNGSALEGGAIGLRHSSLDLHDNVLRDCNATTDGGAMYVHDSHAEIYNNRFMNNHAGSMGGGICTFATGHGTGHITDNVISGNRAGLRGGGVQIGGGGFTVSGNVISDNEAMVGGASSS